MAEQFDQPHESPRSPPTPSRPPGEMTGREAYNVVSDTVVGVNLRGSDNAMQAAVIAVCVVIGILIGVPVAWWYAQPWFIGAVGGLLAGLIIGVLGSGIFLMIYRMVQHARGRHG